MAKRDTMQPLFGDRQYLGRFIGTIGDIVNDPWRVEGAHLADLWVNHGKAYIAWGKDESDYMQIDVLIPHEDKMLVVCPPVFGEGAKMKGEILIQNLVVNAFDVALRYCSDEIVMSHIAAVTKMWHDGEILGVEAVVEIRRLSAPNCPGIIIDAADLDAPPAN